MKPLKLRIDEVKNLYIQLETLGLDDRFDEIINFKKIANDYVRNGKEANGLIPMPQTNRVLFYKLTDKEYIPCSITLKVLS